MRTWGLLILVGCSGGSGNGGNCPAYATIVDGSFTRSGSTLTWTLEVEEIPAQMTFDQAAVMDFVQEYNWGIDLDSNRDGQRDWQVSATHFKMGGTEQMTADPLSIAQVDLWKIAGPGATVAGDASATLAGNTFTFTVDDGEDPDLVNIVDADQSTFETFTQFGAALTDQCSDQL